MAGLLYEGPAPGARLARKIQQSIPNLQRRGGLQTLAACEGEAEHGSNIGNDDLHAAP